MEKETFHRPLTATEAKNLGRILRNFTTDLTVKEVQQMAHDLACYRTVFIPVSGCARADIQIDRTDLHTF